MSLDITPNTKLWSESQDEIDNWPPKWEDIKQEEVRRILASEGEKAFIDFRKTNRGPLLRRIRYSGRKEKIVLTRESERNLRVRMGLELNSMPFPIR